MLQVLRQFWNDDEGFIVSTELVLIATILVLGLVAGLSQIAAEINEELGDVAAAISVINQSYSFAGISGHHGLSAGSTYGDADDAGNDGANCIQTCTTGLVFTSEDGTAP